MSTALAEAPEAFAERSLPVALADVQVTVPFGDEALALRFRLDPTQMTQRMMLQAFTQGSLYEPSECLFLSRVLQPGDTFVDAGAHVGFFSVLAAHLVGADGHVVAIEAERRNQSQVLEHIALNAVSNIHLVSQALSDAPGTATFFVNRDNDGGNALWDVGQHFYNAQSRVAPQRRTVLTTTLDRAVMEVGLARPRAVKMDIEGAELAALRGAHALLSAGVPFWLIEVNPPALAFMGVTEAELRAHMSGYGYAPYLLMSGGQLAPVSEAFVVPDDGLANYVFVHQGA
jgi:FkbM family methyltransferase